MKTFWRSLGFLSLLIGLVFLASDVGDIPTAVADWRRVLAIVDLTTALSAFSAVALLYIIWIDLRPFASKWSKSDKYEVSVHDRTAWKVTPCGEINGTNYYVNRCYLSVHNNSRSTRTARNVRVSRYMLSERYPSTIETGAEDVDLHHGERVLFLLGSIVSDCPYGLVIPGSESTEEERSIAKNNVSRGHYSFSIGFASIALMLPGIASENFSDNPLSFITVRVSANDLPTINVELRLDESELRRREGPLPNPIKITSVSRA